MSKKRFFGLLFLCFFCLVSAHVEIENGENVEFENDSASVEKVESVDQIELSNPSQGKIYVTTGTTIVNTTDQNLTIVKIEAPKQNPKGNHFSAPKKLLAAKKPEVKPLKKVEQKKYVNDYHFSGAIPSQIYFSTLTKASFTILNFSYKKKTNNGIVILLFSDFKNTSVDIEPELFLYSDFIFSNLHFTTFSVKPPPFLG